MAYRAVNIDESKFSTFNLLYIDQVNARSYFTAYSSSDNISKSIDQGFAYTFDGSEPELLYEDNNITGATDSVHLVSLGAAPYQINTWCWRNANIPDSTNKTVKVRAYALDRITEGSATPSPTRYYRAYCTNTQTYTPTPTPTINKNRIVYNSADGSFGLVGQCYDPINIKYIIGFGESSTQEGTTVIVNASSFYKQGTSTEINNFDYIQGTTYDYLFVEASHAQNHVWITYTDNVNNCIYYVMFPENVSVDTYLYLPCHDEYQSLKNTLPYTVYSRPSRQWRHKANVSVNAWASGENMNWYRPYGNYVNYTYITVNTNRYGRDDWTQKNGTVAASMNGKNIKPTVDVAVGYGYTISKLTSKDKYPWVTVNDEFGYNYNYRMKYPVLNAGTSDNVIYYWPEDNEYYTQIWYFIMDIPLIYASPVGAVDTVSFDETAHVKYNDELVSYDVYYTTDGSTPTTNSPKMSDYEGNKFTYEFDLEHGQSAVTFNYMAIYSGKTANRTVTVYYLPYVETPVITFDFSGNTTITCATNDTTIYYTTDGSYPTTGSTMYTGSFQVTEGTTVKAVAVFNPDNRKISYVAVATYTGGEPVKINISPATKEYTGVTTQAVDVNIYSNSYTQQHNVYYTTDGSTPTTGSTLYIQPFTVTATLQNPVTVKAIGVLNYAGNTYTYSDQATYTCALKTPKPTIVPSGGTYSETIKASIYAGEYDTIYYTLDGSTPTTGSTQYDGSILIINKTTTIKAIAYNNIYTYPTSDVATETYTISIPARSRKAPREHDNNNGIYVKNVTYSGIPTNLRSAYILPSAITVTDTEADVTWGYRIDNVEEDMGDYGTKCHVTDTSITIYIPFTHAGKQYTLTKEIPCTCIVQDAVDTTDQIDIIEAYAICTLENKFRVNVKARVKHTTEETVGIITDLTNYTLSGSSTNGNFICNKDGSYFLYDDILTLNYSGSVHPANEVLLTLVNNNTNSELDHYTITVTFETGSIFEVRDDAIRMAVQTSHEEISGVTNHLTQLELNVSGITGTVSALTNSVSGISADVSQLQQTASSITATVYNLSGEMVTHSELSQTASAITAHVFDEFGEMTGLDIEQGTITLHADQTIIDGELQIQDGITFRDNQGTPVTTIDGENIDNYSTHNNGTVSYFNAEGDGPSGSIQFGYTTERYAIGNYKSGDTISFQLIEADSRFFREGQTPLYDTAQNINVQIQLSVYASQTVPYSSTTVTLNKLSGQERYSLEAAPIAQFTVPEDTTIFCKFVVTSNTSAPSTGHGFGAMWIRYGANVPTFNHVGKSGIIIDHTANNTTYIGPDQFTVRKLSDGFSFRNFPDRNGDTRYIPCVSNMNYSYTQPSTPWPDNPDKHNNNVVYGWMPQANYTPHTLIKDAVTQNSHSTGAIVEYGQVSGYTEYGDYSYLRLDERYIVGDIWVDHVMNSEYSEMGRFAILLPPSARWVTVNGISCLSQLPVGYTVRIHNFYSAYGSHEIYIWGNHMDCASGYDAPTRIYKPSNDQDKSIYFNAYDTFIELVYQGTWTDGISEELYQRWYIRNWNNQ